MTIARASRPRAGETVNGDAICVRHTDTRTLVAVVDGLGHGPEAALASQRAVAHLDGAAITGSASALMEQLHAVLVGTRGAAAVLCLFERGRVRVSGVGNVELRCLGGSLGLPMNPGILGHRVRHHVEVEGELRRGERLAVFSDGISGRLDLSEHRHLDAEPACHAILERHGRPYDDASIVVIDVERQR